MFYVKNRQLNLWHLSLLSFSPKNAVPQTSKHIKKEIINSSNNNFLPLVKHFLMTHCFETKNRLMQSWNLFVTFSAERMDQDLWVAADPATRGSGRSRGVPHPPYFWTKMRPKGPKQIFGGRLLPLPLSKGLDDHHPPSLISRLGSGLRGAGRIAG